MPDAVPLRVLELGTSSATAYASKLLADQGADVVKLETLDGDPLRRRRDHESPLLEAV